MNSYKKKSTLFLASQNISLFGSSLVQFAMIWYVTMQTSSGAWVSAMSVASYIPQFFISFFAGVWADRHSRKKLIIISDSMIAVATLLLAVLFPMIPDGTPILLSLVLISAIRSIGTGIQTPAVNATIPQLVPESKLMKYNGINMTIQSIVQFAAPATAGAILSWGTLRATLLIDIATAMVGIGILFAVAIPFEKKTDTPSMLSEMKVGIKYSMKEPFIGKLLIFFGIFIFLCVPAGFLATLFVNRYYGETYWYMTLVEVIGFIGMTAGGIIIGAWGGFRNRMKTLVVGSIAFGILAIGMGAINNFIIYLILMAIYGIALTMVQTAVTTLFQEQSSSEMIGRVFGLFGAMYSGFLPLGMVVFGPLADKVSMRLLMILSGILLIIMSLAVLFNRKFYLHGTISEDKISDDKTEEKEII